MDRGELLSIAESMGLTSELFERKKRLLELSERDIFSIKSYGGLISEKVEKIVQDLESFFVGLSEARPLVEKISVDDLRRGIKKYVEGILEGRCDYQRCLELVEIGSFLFEFGVPYYLITAGYRKLSSFIFSSLAEAVPEEVYNLVRMSLEKLLFFELMLVMQSYFFAEERDLRRSARELKRLTRIQTLIKDLHKHIIRSDDVYGLLQGFVDIFIKGCSALKGAAVCRVFPEEDAQVAVMKIRRTPGEPYLDDLFKRAFSELSGIAVEQGTAFSIHLLNEKEGASALLSLRDSCGVQHALCFPVRSWEDLKGTVCFLGLQPLSFSEVEMGMLADVFSDLGIVWAHVEAREKLREAHLKDHLTGLPKRDLFMEGLDAILKTKDSLCLVILDVENLWMINHEYGYTVGDQLLQSISRRIRNLSFVALSGRIGEDNFALVIPADQGEGLSIFLKELKQVLEKPYSIQGFHIIPSLNLGCALFPEDGESASVLISRAELAIKNIKDGKGVEGIAFYSPELLEDIRRYREMEKEVERALESGEFELFFQPRVDVFSRRVVGAEVLLRWNHPERGLLSPCQFIPFLEKSGWIREVGLWVIDSACKVMKETFLPKYNLAISCNVSPIQLKQPDFRKEMLRIVNKSGLNPEALRLEITENALVDETVLKSVGDMRKDGFGWEIDDFGTGYSSLVYLKKVPASVLKIDYSFVRGLPDNKEDTEIVKLIVSLSRALGLRTVAEGVERFEQLVFLTGLGVHEVQGYYFSRPMPLREFLSYVDNYKPDMYFWAKSR